MKKLFITTILLLPLFCGLKAQTAPPQQKETPVSISILPSQISTIQQIFAFSFQWLPKSDAPARDVQTVLPAIQQMFAVIQLPADSVKKKPTAPQKAINKK